MFKKIVWLWFSSNWKNSVDIKKYIKELVDWWANEFFTGYNPSYWYEKFWFEVSPNWRFAEHEQITDFETLKQVTEEAHSHSIEIFANLNYWYYTDETFDLIKKMIEEFESIKIDWIICWNISILEYLKEINYKGKINVSTIMALYNKESIKFLLNNYKINKIILSREITLKEIEEIVDEFPDVLFEVFWEGDFCRYNNWLCFAEHKYSNKDICTVVLNELVIKDRFRSDYKKIILNDSLSALEKSELFNAYYSDIFDMIKNTCLQLELWLDNELELKKDLKNLILMSKNRVDLYFDSMKAINSEHNQNIITYIKALKYLNLEEFEILQKELELSFKSWLKYYAQMAKNLWGENKIKAKEILGLYSRNDSLNLYSYLFFNNFKNIETVKFPTRWRNYNEKIKTIEKVLKLWWVDIRLLDRWIWLDRVHYDLSYLFWNKTWFRNLLKDFY